MSELNTFYLEKQQYSFHVFDHVANGLNAIQCIQFTVYTIQYTVYNVYCIHLFK